MRATATWITVDQAVATPIQQGLNALVRLDVGGCLPDVCPPRPATAQQLEPRLVSGGARRLRATPSDRRGGQGTSRD